MCHSVIDTNVPLTAAGVNTQASEACKLTCAKVVNRILKGEVTVVLDEDDEAILEYRQKMYPDPKGTPAGRFLSYILANMHQPSRVQKVKLLKNELSQFQDYPDGDEDWTSNVRRCERFDPDDKSGSR